MEYSVKELHILGDACVSIFLLVAGSDGRLSAAERAIFLRDHVRAILAARIIDAEHEQAIMEIMLQEYNSEEKISALERRPVSDDLQALRRATSLIASKEDDGAVKRYRVAMMSLAKNIADASRGLLGLGASTSSKEAQMLERIRSSLSP